MPSRQKYLRHDPGMAVAMVRMIQAIDEHRPGGDSLPLALHSAALTSAARRMLLSERSSDVHGALKLASDIDQFERRWTGSVTITLALADFIAETRALVGRLSARLAANRDVRADTAAARDVRIA